MRKFAGLVASVAQAVPEPEPAPPPGLESLGQQVVDWSFWIAIIAALVGFALVAIKMAIGQRGRSQMAADGASGIPWVIGALFLISSASALVSALLNQS
jgi:hypothetical protein